MSVIHVKNKKEFMDYISDTDKTHIIVDFYALWCRPCTQFNTTYLSMSQKYTNVLFLKVDVEMNDELADKYSVSSMPTFILLEKGNYKPIGVITGANKDKLEQLLDKL